MILFNSRVIKEYDSLPLIMYYLFMQEKLEYDLGLMNSSSLLMD